MSLPYWVFGESESKALHYNVKTPNEYIGPQVASFNLMVLVVGVVLSVICSVCLPSPASGKDAILPQGDPRIQASDADEHNRREEIRKNRLKQQGQGENYRIEGELQGGSRGPKAEEATGHNREETGIEDPSVNLGQASGLKTVRGRVLKSEENYLTIEQANGEETVLTIDPHTRLNSDVHPGDRITGTVTNQGRAVMVHKEGMPQP